jgi:hypothetical protein
MLRESPQDLQEAFAEAYEALPLGHPDKAGPSITGNESAEVAKYRMKWWRNRVMKAGALAKRRASGF